MTQTIQSPQTLPGRPSAGTRRRQTIATLLGERSFEAIDWRRLIQDGVLVRLHIRRCRFSTRLTLEDIGIRVDDDTVREKLSKWLILGEKRLLPVAYMKALSRLESGARYVLKERSFRTELGAFVPSSAYIAWRDTTAELKTQYEALRDEIIANHRSLTQQVLAEYEVIAADTYQRLCGTHPELVRETQEHFVTAYCNRITSQIPSPDRIRETFAFTYLLVDGLSQLETTQAQRSVQEEQETTVDVARSQVQQREWQRSVLEQDLRRHAQERVSMALDSFLSSVVSQLRTLTYDVTCDVLATLQRRGGETLAHQSVRQLHNLLTQVRALNFYGDTEMERMMEQMQSIVEQSPEERQRGIADIGRTLRAIATVTRATLLDLEEEPREARGVTIPNLPTESAVRQARAELGLDLDATQFATLAYMRAEVREQRAEVREHGMQPLWAYLEGDAQRAPRTV